MKLSVTERQSLKAWSNCEVGFGFGFKVAAERSGVPCHKIRRAVRALARKGALEFQRTLFDEYDGAMVGAGYVLTDAGLKNLEQSL